MVGTMIELPRAALVADEIAQEAEFFSFGTKRSHPKPHSAFSRDDINKFLPDYIEQASSSKIRLPCLIARAWPVGEDGNREGPQEPIESEGRHLRRAGGDPVVGRILPPDWPELCLLFAVPRFLPPLGAAQAAAQRQA